MHTTQFPDIYVNYKGVRMGEGGVYSTKGKVKKYLPIFKEFTSSIPEIAGIENQK